MAGLHGGAWDNRRRHCAMVAAPAKSDLGTGSEVISVPTPANG